MCVLSALPIACTLLRRTSVPNDDTLRFMCSQMTPPPCLRRSAASHRRAPSQAAGRPANLQRARLPASQLSFLIGRARRATRGHAQEALSSGRTGGPAPHLWNRLDILLKTAMMSGLLLYLVMFIWFCVTSMIAACTSGLLKDMASSGSAMIFCSTCRV